MMAPGRAEAEAA
jgi:hypothetical protein